MINKGIYRHFKGNYYEVIDTVRNSESGQEMVLYKNVLMDDLWVRPLDMFLEEVVCNGVKVKRFS